MTPAPTVSLTPAAYAREAERLRFMARRLRDAPDGDPTKARKAAKRLDRQCLAMLRRAEG